jgi:hypothetical protein
MNEVIAFLIVKERNFRKALARVGYSEKLINDLVLVCVQEKIWS